MMRNFKCAIRGLREIWRAPTCRFVAFLDDPGGVPGCANYPMEKILGPNSRASGFSLQRSATPERALFSSAHRLFYPIRTHLRPGR